MLCALAAVLLLAAQAVPPDPARSGWEAIQRGDGEKAAALFKLRLADHPDDVRSLTGAALAAHLIGRDDQGLSYAKRAVQLDPANAYGFYVLGQLAYAQGDVDLAIKSYEKVIAIAPGSPAIYQQLEAWKKEAALHETYTTRPSARFNVMFEGSTQQAIAARVSTTLESAYGQIGVRLSYPPDTVTAILYTGEQFRDITRSPAWAAAAYDGRIRIPVRGALSQPSELDRVVTHEYVHAVLHQLYPRVPHWLNEGLATYFEPSDHAWLLRRLRGGGTLIPLSRLNDAFQTADGGDALVAYAESYVGARVLAERLGPNLPVFLQYVSNGTAVDQALMLFNISVADVEREWNQRAR